MHAFVGFLRLAALLVLCGLLSRLAFAVAHFGWALPDLVMR